MNDDVAGAGPARPVLLPGQHALITGAGSGIGRAIALALAAEGLRLTLVGRDRAKLAEVATRCGAEATVASVDLATEDGIERAARAAGTRLHVLVNSAGLHAREPAEAMPLAARQYLDAVNLHAPLRLTAACLPCLQAARGQIVMVNSTAALATAPNGSAYAAGKHALRAATDALRQDLGGRNIRVMSVYPGRTDTPMQSGILAAEGRTAGEGSLMRPEDVALMVVAALKLPATAEVTDIVMRAPRPL